MQRAPGTRLDSAWPDMPENIRATTITQLKEYFEQLRNIRLSTSDWIGSCHNGPVYDHRLNNGFPCGPFTSVSEFHDFLVAPVTQRPRPELAVWTTHTPRGVWRNTVHPHCLQVQFQSCSQSTKY
jgi:hypothetical protein